MFVKQQGKNLERQKMSKMSEKYEKKIQISFKSVEKNSNVSEYGKNNKE